METNAVTSPPNDEPNEDPTLPDPQTEPGAPVAAEKTSRRRVDRRVLYALLAVAVIVPSGILLVARTADREAQHPQFSNFTSGTFTHGWGNYWGVEHRGVDVEGPRGTPILAVADGTVLEAGLVDGFGMWVRLLHDDGTVTVYGHIDTVTVSQGQRVSAGDQIATLGNRGFSVTPHCHFEVWLHGHEKVDPLPWLTTRGISLGPQAP